LNEACRAEYFAHALRGRLPERLRENYGAAGSARTHV